MFGFPKKTNKKTPTYLNNYSTTIKNQEIDIILPSKIHRPHSNFIGCSNDVLYRVGIQHRIRSCIYLSCLCSHFNLELFIFPCCSRPWYFWGVQASYFIEYTSAGIFFTWLDSGCAFLADLKQLWCCSPCISSGTMPYLFYHWQC